MGRQSSGKVRQHILIDPALMERVRRTADVDNRSIGHQIEHLLMLGLQERDALTADLNRRRASA